MYKFKWVLISMLILLAIICSCFFMQMLISIVYFLLGAILYFLPTIIARKKSFVLPVFILNLFLGFTFIGWVVALVWSVKNDN